MGAYLNALREEGTKEDLLVELEKQMDRVDNARKALRQIRNYRRGMLRETCPCVVEGDSDDCTHGEDHCIIMRTIDAALAGRKGEG